MRLDVTSSSGRLQRSLEENAEYLAFQRGSETPEQTQAQRLQQAPYVASHRATETVEAVESRGRAVAEGAQQRRLIFTRNIWSATFNEGLPERDSELDSTRLTMAVRIATGTVAYIGGSEGFAIGCRSRHNFPRNIGRRILPYKAMNLFPGRVLGRCRVQPEPVARSLTHRPCMRRKLLPQSQAARARSLTAAPSARLLSLTDNGWIALVESLAALADSINLNLSLKLCNEA
ncbi:hypothetical protein EVAR_8017_1 [Eumeta japonica]|uniref:Uncharacterized protein n=1 Tax=Eumeta variegata TaxID=151549 RepID=A0A4C1TJN2_EUMVA|nr:hypothetical protein EVAR_8017_1 [Eumeta japonica]